MRRLVVLAVFGVILLAAAGCVSNVGEAVIPSHAAGTWQGQGSAWRIVINPDGTVASAIIPMGEVEVKPNETTKVLMKDNSYSSYKAGDCFAEYYPEEGELYVSVEMEEIHIVFLDNVIDGNSLDYFVGPVSEDGKEWEAEWVNIFDYGPRFPQDPNDIAPVPLLFEKVEE